MKNLISNNKCILIAIILLVIVILCASICCSTYTCSATAITSTADEISTPDKISTPDEISTSDEPAVVTLTPTTPPENEVELEDECYYISPTECYEDIIYIPSEGGETANLGQFTLTAYCPCYSCNGQWAYGPTATGVMPQAGRTIAVDPNVIPYGTKVLINGNTYIAEDCGGAILGNRIDVYFDTHSECMNFGVQTATVEIFV